MRIEEIKIEYKYKLYEYEYSSKSIKCDKKYLF